MKRTIGYKSSGQIAVWVMGLIFIIVFIPAIISKNASFGGTIDELIWVFIIFSGFFIILIVLIIKNLPFPRMAIQYDNQFLYLNYKNETIKLAIDSIIQATPRCAQLRGGRFKFGDIYIHTEMEKFTMKFISDCEDVCLKIMRLKSVNQ